MTEKRGHILKALLIVAAAVGLATQATADDRDLLYSQKAAEPNILVVVSNTESMATCIPGQPLPNGLTCAANNPQLAFDGMGDGPNSKMGIAKWAILNIIRQHPTDFNWGLTSFSVSRANFLAGAPQKRYNFVILTPAFASGWYAQSQGTQLTFGPPVGASTIKSYGTLASARNYQVVPIGGVTSGSYNSATMLGAESWVQTVTGDLNHQPYLLGADATGSTRTLITNPTGSGTSSKEEMVITYVSTTASSGTPQRIRQCVADCTLTDPGFDGQTIVVSKWVVRCASSAPCDPTTGSTVAGPTLETFVVPPTYCSESNTTCSYPMVYGYGSESGEEMGWTDYNESNTSSNQSGWIFQSNTNPQPIVMINHPYTPWTPYGGSIPIKSAQNYTENSGPCIVRAMRPASAIFNNVLAESDAFPIFNPQTDPTCATGNCNTNCDRMVDGVYQTGSFPAPQSQEILPSIFPRLGSGNGAPLVKMLTNAWQYFNGGNSGCSGAGAGVDGFCNGQRADDPFHACRPDFIILITDSFNVPSPGFRYGAPTDPTGQLPNTNRAVGGIPVFVIGFAVSSGSAGANDCPSNPIDPTFNTGQCIAYYTGATKTTVPTRQGYYLANKPAQLLTDLTLILNSLNTTNRDFATATIPSVSSTSEGVAYLSQFNPRNNRSIWSGHLRAFALDPTTGLIQTQNSGPNAGQPSAAPFVFGSGTTPPSGSMIWEAGSTGGDTPGFVGNLDDGCSSCSPSRTAKIDPTLLLTASPGAGGSWSDSVHDQATGRPGRNVFFGIRPGDPGCLSSTTYECLVQVPVGSTGSTPPGPAGSLNGDTSGWANVRDSLLYARIPASVPETGNDRDQALQNAFSFMRGNRDPVVESLKISSKFDATHTDCVSFLSETPAETDPPCYYGDILGDIFHSNPVVSSFPNNVRYYFAQDPGAGSFGTYADRGHSYQIFFTNYAHRRKILFAGADDGLLHAFDIGVYNGDQSSYTDSNGNTVQPYLNHYDLGSGREIFAFAPLAGLNKFYQLSHTVSHDWTIDGPPALDDVYIDVTRVGQTPQGIVSPPSSSDIGGTSPTWRTVLVGTEREGGLITAGGGISSGTSGRGGSVFALDVTDPDTFATMAQSFAGTPQRGVPQCIVDNFTPGTSGNPQGNACNAPYPRILWELRDDGSISTVSAPTPAETAGGGEDTTQDLGMTWSKPVIGRIKVNSGGAPRDFFVAIFGGGYDHTSPSLSATYTAGNTGNFLYMVDIETGKVIYKRNLGLCTSGGAGCSAAQNPGNLAAGLPGEPAAIDINGDGYLDAIYIGDTEGRLWKVNTTTAPGFSSGMITNSDWSPMLMFDENPSAPAVRQPIFTRPEVFLINTTPSGQARLGVAFGTGDRDNMPVLTDNHNNWFIVVVDDPTISYPLTLGNLTQASLVANNCSGSGTCLQANGYYLNLPTVATGAQIVNTNSLVFSQTIFFNAFLHTTTPGDCNQVGKAFFYKLNYLTGESLYTDVNGNPVPNQEANSEVASEPIVYQDVNTWVVSATDNTSVQNVGGGTPPAVNIKSWKEQ